MFLPLAGAAGCAVWLYLLAVRGGFCLPALRFYRCSALRAPLLPLIAAFYLAATLHSVAYRGGKGDVWKGGAQA